MGRHYNDNYIHRCVPYHSIGVQACAKRRDPYLSFLSVKRSVGIPTFPTFLAVKRSVGMDSCRTPFILSSPFLLSSIIPTPPEWGGATLNNLRVECRDGFLPFVWMAYNLVGSRMERRESYPCMHSWESYPTLLMGGA